MTLGRKLSCILAFALIHTLGLSYLLRAQQPGGAGSTQPSANEFSNWETEADESFALKLSFALRPVAGISTLRLHATDNFEYRIDFGDKAVTVRQVQAGKNTALATHALEPGTGGSLLLFRRGTILRIALNGEVIFDNPSLPGQIEKITLANASGRLQLSEALRYQPAEEIFLTDDFMVQPGTESHWQTVSGSWSVAGVSTPGGAADPFKFVSFTTQAGSPHPGGIAVNRDSYWFWNDYQSDVAVRLLGERSTVGLIFNYRGPRDYFCLSWGGAGTGPDQANRLRLWRRAGDKSIQLAERIAYARSGQWYRLSVHTLGVRIAAYIDDAQALVAADPHMVGGQCGVYQNGEAGAEFDDFAARSVSGTRLLPARERNSDAAWRERNFATDPFMAAWGAPGADWEPVVREGQRWFWNRAYYFNSVDLRLALPSAGELQPSVLKPREIVVMANDDGAGGYRLRIEPKRLALYRYDQLLTTADGEATGDIKMQVRGGEIAVSCGDKRLLSYLDKNPLASGRAGIRIDGYAQPPAVAQAVEVTSPTMREYRFDVAPVDWEVESGEWQTTTRWACVPDWNFFGGRGVPIATVWNKRRFGGDLWIDAFLSPREGSTDRMHFTQPVNLNLTFSADGTRLGSGYALVFRSHDRSTILYRAGKPVVENTQLVLPGWRDDDMGVYYRIAQTWQHFQILKQGNRIRVWFEVPSAGRNMVERQLLVDYTDPTPLQGDRMALWTWGQNGMSVARLALAAARSEGLVNSTFEKTATLEGPAPALKTAATVSAPAGAVRSDRVRRVNPINGGRYRTDLIEGPASIDKLPVVEFEYKADPAVALALYAVVAGQPFKASFLGSIGDDGDAVPMGKVLVTPGAGGWRRARFALRQALRDYFPNKEMPPVDELFVADLSDDPEHVGGLSVNPRGAVLELKPVATTAATSAAGRAVAELRNVAGPPHDVLRIALVNDSNDPRDFEIGVNSRRLVLGDKGLRWDGSAHEYELDLSAAGLSLDDGESVRLTLSDRQGISEKIARPLFSRSWQASYANDKRAPETPSIRVGNDPDRIDDFETDIGSWRRLGGEQGATLWRVPNDPSGGADDVTSEGSSGRYHLRLYHRQLSGTNGVVIRDRPFDARRWPVLNFNYRLQPHINLNLICEIAGRSYEMRFCNDDSTFNIIGSIGNVRRDDRWHRAEVRLLDALRNYRINSTIISRLYFADTGTMNNLQDISWRLDNFRFVPALPEASPATAEATTFHWVARDSSGIAGYSWVMDNAAETVPPETIKDAATSAAAAAGATYLHVRARDRAGNWGAPAHFRFAWLPASKTATAIGIGADQSDAAAAKALSSPAVQMSINGADIVDIESLNMRVRAVYDDGKSSDWKTYDATGGQLRFDPRRGVLSWGDPAFSKNTPENHYKLEAEINARDIASSIAMAERREWTVQTGLDTTGPPAPYVSYVPANRLCRYDFEKSLPEEFQLRRTAWVLHDEENGATGQRSGRIVNLSAYDFFSAYLRKAPIPVHRFPMVSFDYRLDPGQYNLNLTSVVNGNLQVVKMTDDEDWYHAFREGLVGRLSEFRTDGEWHNATFDFGAMLQKRYPDLQRFFAESLETWATGPRAYYNPQGVSMRLDNITFYSTAATSAGFEWSVPNDDNGIRGYSYKLDQNPLTEPEARILTDKPEAQFNNLQPGKWFFHVRACDGAGNWGKTAHSAIELTRAG